jgi:hypothetical protein
VPLRFAGNEFTASPFLTNFGLADAAKLDDTMRRKVILAVTLSVLAFGVIYVWTFGFFPGKDLKRTQALRTLVAQNVRIGDSPELVIRFLDAQHLDHSTFMKPEYMLISGHDYSKQNVIAAIKRNVVRSLL